MWKPPRALGGITRHMHIGGLAAVIRFAIFLIAHLAGAGFALAQSQFSGWTIEVTPQAATSGIKPKPSAPSKPTITRVSLTEEANLTRLVFDLNRKIDVSVSTLVDPDRVVVDLPEVDFRISPTAGQNGKGLVKAFRFGLFDANQSRVVIDTDGPVRVVKAQVEGKKPQLVLEFGRATPGSGTVTDRSKPALRPGYDEEPLVETARVSDRPLIVIDPGHGGLDPGAAGPDGLLEKDVVLAVALRLRKLLAETGRYSVIMTRDKDIYVSLDQRVRISRRHKADLFISLHADAVPEESLASVVRGGSVYTLSEHASSEQARRLAEKENAVDILAGVQSLANEEADEVRNILFDLLQRETANFSADFSRLLTNELRKHIALARDPQRSAAFKVLQQPESPSVLIELGFMSNADDQKLLRSPEWQNKVARAILAAIDSFFAKRALGAVYVP